MLSQVLVFNGAGERSRTSNATNVYAVVKSIAGSGKTLVRRLGWIYPDAGCHMRASAKQAEVRSLDRRVLCDQQINTHTSKTTGVRRCPETGQGIRA